MDSSLMYFLNTCDHDSYACQVNHTTPASSWMLCLSTSYSAKLILGHFLSIKWGGWIQQVWKDRLLYCACWSFAVLPGLHFVAFRWRLLLKVQFDWQGLVFSVALMRPPRWLSPESYLPKLKRWTIFQQLHDSSHLLRFLGRHHDITCCWRWSTIIPIQIHLERQLVFISLFRIRNGSFDYQMLLITRLIHQSS